jgi:hypothetical protein
MKFGYNFSNQWLKDPFNYSEERTFKLLSRIDMDCLEVQLAVLGIIDNKGNINNAQKEKIISLLKKYKINVGSVHENIRLMLVLSMLRILIMFQII